MEKYEPFSSFKSKKEEMEFNNFSKSRLANEKWAEHYFVVPLTFIKSSEKEEKQALENTQLKILDLVSEEFGKGTSLRMIGKDILIHISKVGEINMSGKLFNNYEIFVRFVDIDKISRNKESFLFSMSQSILSLIIFPIAEEKLLSTFKIKVHPLKITSGYQGKELIVTETDGCVYFSYYIKKRIELYSKFPGLDKKIFHSDFKVGIKKILNRKNENREMEKICGIIEKLLKEYNIKLK